jgi:tRNA(Leu) C34 or U34 (ribose-2'-O)-methylase TrmL
VEPCGFPYSDKAVRRAAMDYAAKVALVSHVNWAAFEVELNALVRKYFPHWEAKDVRELLGRGP